jgi:hypothetical protein
MNTYLRYCHKHQIGYNDLPYPKLFPCCFKAILVYNVRLGQPGSANELPLPD